MLIVVSSVVQYWEGSKFQLTFTSLCRAKARQAILQLCKDAMKFKTTVPCWDWLFVLPLCDFLSGDAEPFARLEYRPTLVGVKRAQEFGYGELRTRSQFQPGYIHSYVHERS